MDRKSILKIIFLISIFLFVNTYVFADDDICEEVVYSDEYLYNNTINNKQMVDELYANSNNVDYSEKYNTDEIVEYIYENSVNRIKEVNPVRTYDENMNNSKDYIEVDLSQFNILYDDWEKGFKNDIFMGEELFYWSFVGYSHLSNSDYLRSVFIYTYMTQDEVNDAVNKINIEKQKYLSGIRKEWNELEIGIYTSDYLAALCSYNHEIDDKEFMDGNVYWPYHKLNGALVEKKPLSEGYAKAFKYLMKQAGVDSKVVFSEWMFNHAWNLMKINGKYYHIDVAWNDEEANPSSSYYKYSFYSDYAFENVSNSDLKRHYDYNKMGIAKDTSYDNCAWKLDNTNSSFLTYHNGYWFYLVNNGTNNQVSLYKLDLRNYNLNNPILVNTIQIPTSVYISESGYSMMGDCKYLYVASKDTIYKMDYDGNNLVKIFDRFDNTNYLLRFMPFDKKMNIFHGYNFVNNNQENELRYELKTISIFNYEHNWSTNYTIDKEPEEFVDGQKSIHCTECDEINEESIVVIPKTSKDFDNIFREKVKSINNYIYLNEFKNNLKLNDFINMNTDYTYKLLSSNNIELSNTSIVGTNMKLKVLDSKGNIINEFVFLVKGDLSGNGKSTLYDVFGLLKLVIKNQYSNYEGIIADYTCDGNVTMNDMYQLLKYVLKH